MKYFSVSLEGDRKPDGRALDDDGPERRRRRRGTTRWEMEAGTGTILLNWAAAPTSERSSPGRGILIFGPPFAGDPWDDRPTLGPNVRDFLLPFRLAKRKESKSAIGNVGKQKSRLT